MKTLIRAATLAALALCALPAAAQTCRDAVVLVHGNTGAPDD